MHISDTERCLILLKDKDPVRLCWTTSPIANATRGDRPVAQVKSVAFDCASHAVSCAVAMWGSDDFHEACLVDAEMRRLTFGDDLARMVAQEISRRAPSVNAAVSKVPA